MHELQLGDGSEHPSQTKPVQVVNLHEGVCALTEANLREFNNTLKGKRALIRQIQYKPKVNRWTRKFLLEDHDYMNVVETNLDDDSSDEDVARINNKLYEAFVRLQNKDFSNRKCHGRNYTNVESKMVCITTTSTIINIAPNGERK